jgi:hypothetical protein
MANPWEENYEGSSAAPWEQNYAAPEVSLADEFKRQMGLTARYGLEGVGSVLDLAQAPVRGLMNLALPKDKQLQPVSAGGSLADVFGFPQPQNARERVIGDVSRTLAGTGATMGLGGMASPASSTGRAVQQSLVSNPITQMLGATGAGIGSGLTRESGGGEIAQMAAGLAGGFAGGSIISPKSIKMTSKELQNIPKDKLLTEAQNAGFVALPSDVKAGRGSKALETMSGKIKSEELFSSKNQDTANNYTRKYLGLEESAPLNAETLDSLRSNQSPAYEAIKNTGVIDLGNKNPFASIVKNVKSTKGGRDPLLGELKPNYTIDSSDAVEQIKLLRSDGNDYYRSGTNIEKPNPKLKELGQKYINEANKLENILESHVKKLGKPELIENFRNARKEIAKTYTVEKALVGENVVDYRKIGKMIGKKQPITDELALVGKFAKEFPRVNKPVAYEPTAFTLPDVYASAVGAGLDLLTGVPLASGIPAARVTSRYLMESAPFQNRFVKPQYKKITTPYVPYMGLLNSPENQ